VGHVSPSAHANRVLYRHSSLSEWYANGPLGVEQGFTIARSPAGHTAGPLTLSIALSGNAQVSLASAGRSIVFTRAGKTGLRYTGLTATDARGHLLRSWLQLDSGQLLLRVDARAARYPLTIDPFIQQGSKLTANDEVGRGFFGHSVALSGDGNTALVGGSADNTSVGAAWVFVRSGSAWIQQGPKLIPTGGGSSAFGISVALSGDGNTALIGSDGDGAGVFVRSNSTWTQQGPRLIPNDQAGGAFFAYSVALSRDGNTALIGGPTDNTSVGAAWVFVRSNSTWTQQGPKLTANDETGTGYFGWSVALSADANTALIGGLDDNNRVGAAWVFVRSSSTWTQQGSKLTANDETGQGQFGYRVALSGDGGTALIGPDTPQLGGSGAAWVFVRSSSTWTQQGSKLTANDETPPGQFGYSVALSEDASAALIGGEVDNNNVGAAWVFTSQPVPTVTGVSPTSGPSQGATNVIITGAGFTGATGVKFGNTKANGFTVNSATGITAVAPPWAGGPDGARVNVSVTTPAGTSAVSPSDGYRYLPPYPVEILEDQPLVYWRFGERAGATAANDLSGHGLAGTYSAVSLGRPGALRGDPSTAMGLGQGDLNPPSSPTEVAHRASKGLPSGATPRTIELWYRTALANPGGSLVSYGGDATHTPFDIQLEGGGTEIAVSGGTAVARAKLPASLAARSAVIPAGSGNTFTYWTGAWHLLDVTYDGKQLTVYEDGKAVGSPIADPGVTTTTLGYPLAVGGTAGDYQEFALYPTALSAERILAHFNTGQTPVPFPGVSAPRVTRVSPDEGANDLGQKVTVFGANFKTGAQVLFGGHLAFSTTFVSASELEAVLPFFSLSQAGAANVTVIGNGTSNSMPFYVWTHAIGQLMFDDKYPKSGTLPKLSRCTASVLDSQSGGVLVTAGHCTGNAMTSDGHAWAFAPGYTGNPCLSAGETNGTTDLPTTLGCGFAPEGIWTADKANSRTGCAGPMSCATTGADWGFIAPNHATDGTTIVHAVSDGQFQAFLEPKFGAQLSEMSVLFGQAGAGLESCALSPSNTSIGAGGKWEVNSCHGVLADGASGGSWLTQAGAVGAVNKGSNDGSSGDGTPLTATIEPEYCALAGSPCF
jgi:hypothetical protein